MKIRADDNVIVIRGRDRGKQGQVTRTYPKEGKVLVEGVGVVVRHHQAVWNRAPGRNHTEGDAGTRSQPDAGLHTLQQEHQGAIQGDG